MKEIMVYRCDCSVICSLLLCSGERLTEKEVNEIMAECCDEEDEDGFIPYERKYTCILIRHREKKG